MTLADKLAAIVQPVIDRKVAQAKFEAEHVTFRPDRAQRDLDNAEHDAAERHTNGN